MANISAFRSLHYNTQKVDLSDVITPPYDVISPEEAPKYLNRSPYNFAHLDLARHADDDDSQSAQHLAKWQEHGVLVEEEAPAYYLYQQTYQVNGVKHQRQTLLATVELVEFSEGSVRPHENTFGKYKEDRLRLMTKTRSNLSPIFAMVKDREGFLASTFEEFVYAAPLLEARDDEGVDHAVWKIEPGKTKGINLFFAERPIYIVDGHHRYESALRYARESGAYGQMDNPAAHTLCAIANAFDPALVVLPTHRFVQGIETTKLNLESIEQTFDIMRLSVIDLKRFVSKPPPVPSFGLYLENDLYLCTPKHWRSEEANWGRALAKLSVAWSDNRFLVDYCGIDETNRGSCVSYGKDLDALWEKRSQAKVILFHAPPAIDEITSIADDKRFMPQKSTYFYPKIAAGLIFRSLA